MLIAPCGRFSHPEYEALLHTPAFELHARLAADTHRLGHFPLCQLLLLNDCQYPWLILVPQRTGITEAFQLNDTDQQQLTVESNHLSAVLSTRFKADKINVAALGNMVPQLHIHHIARYTSDRSWPHPVWGRFTAIPYEDHSLAQFRQRLLPHLYAGFSIQ